MEENVLAENVIAAHKFTKNNRGLFCNYQPAWANCGYCFEIFDPIEIKKWWDENQTAVCPKCGVDAVIPSVLPLDKDFLEAFYKYWFSPKKPKEQA